MPDARPWPDFEPEPDPCLELDSGVELEGEEPEERTGGGSGGGNAEAAHRSALRSLSAREMSGFEVARALRRKGHSAGIARTVVERLRSEGWIDDLRFACVFLRHRVRSKPCALGHLRAELRKRGCDLPTIETALSRVAEEEDLGELALAVAAARRGPVPTDGDVDRALRFLARRGFSLEVSRQALSELARESETQPDDPS